MHEHFEPETAAADRPFTSEAVDLIAELLRGEIEVHTTYRSQSVIRIEHLLRDQDGELSSLGVTRLLTPAALKLWSPKQTTVERVSFL